ncbi:MAG: hypothetical protein M3Z21_09925, partial [Pseudomonadota bacterium]|nr:hypothetical protein [Pseudomonadota bacterium]
MSSDKALARAAGRWLRRLGVGLVLLSALVVLLTPGLALLRAPLEQSLGAFLHLPVAIGGLRAQWRGWGPVIDITDLEVAAPQGATLARFRAARA